MQTITLRKYMCLLLCAAVAAFGSACAAGDVDDETSPDVEPAHPTATTAAALSTASGSDALETADATMTAAAPSCAATPDGGKWCCQRTSKGWSCWKVPPPPPPDTIYTRW